MSASNLESIDRSVQKLNIWLKDVMANLETSDRHQAYLALKTTLHALRDYLSIEEAAQFGAQLPLVVRGLFYEGWRPARRPERSAARDTFMQPVSTAWRTSGLTPDEVVSAVFEVLSRRVSGGEVDDVIGQLPPRIRALWPAPARAVLR